MVNKQRERRTLPQNSMAAGMECREGRVRKGARGENGELSGGLGFWAPRGNLKPPGIPWRLRIADLHRCLLHR